MPTTFPAPGTTAPTAPSPSHSTGRKRENGERYTVHDLFESTGTARLFTHIASMENGMFTEIDVDEQGVPIAHYEGYGSEGIERSTRTGTRYTRRSTDPSPTCSLIRTTCPWMRS